MTERDLAVRDWPQGRSVPDRLRVALLGQIYKPRDNLYGAPGWFDRDVVATVEVAVDFGPAERMAP